MPRPRILISACLCGVNCRYSGDGKKIPELETLMEAAELIPVCPEILGGLTTPRKPSERQGDRVVMNDGTDVTAAYRRGAEESLYLAELFGARLALLKERSPSCGSGEIYDGSFTGAKKPGDGVTAELLKSKGVRVFGETQIQDLIEEIKRV